MKDVIVKIEQINTKLKNNKSEQNANEICITLKNILEEINNILFNIIWTNKLLDLIYNDINLKNIYRKIYDVYEEVKISLKNEYGNPIKDFTKINLCDVETLINEVKFICDDYESAVFNLMNKTIIATNSNRSLALSLSIIPDIDINPQVFQNKITFLKKMGLNSKNIANLTGKSEQTMSSIIQEWNVIQETVVAEMDKLDLEKLRNKGLSYASIKFIENIISKGEISLADIDGSSIEEIKSFFPELSKKIILYIE